MRMKSMLSNSIYEVWVFDKYYTMEAIMSDNFYSSMYGAKKPEPKVSTQVAPTPVKPIPAAGQRLSGLKLTNSHMHEVEINGRYVTIPSAAYVKLLEDQIKEFRSLVRQQGEDLKRAIRAVNNLNREMDRLKTQMAGTVKTKAYRDR